MECVSCLAERREQEALIVAAPLSLSKFSAVSDSIWAADEGRYMQLGPFLLGSRYSGGARGRFGQGQGRIGALEELYRCEDKLGGADIL